MRETGPVNKNLTGDQDASATQVTQARTQLGILKNQMTLGNLAFGRRTVQLEDGTTITATSIHGFDQISIDTVPAPEPEVLPDIPEPEIPEVQPQQVWQYAWICGSAEGSDSLFLPITIDGTTYSEASYRPYGAGKQHTILKGRKWILFGAVDIVTGIPMDISYQPKTLTTSSDQADQGAVEYTAEEALHLLKTTSRPMAVIALPPATSVDTLFSVHVGAAKFDILIPAALPEVTLSATLFNGDIGFTDMTLVGSGDSGSAVITGTYQAAWTAVSESTIEPYPTTENNYNRVELDGFNDIEDLDFPGAVTTFSDWGQYQVGASGGSLSVTFTGIYAIASSSGIAGRTATYSASGSYTGIMLDGEGNVIGRYPMSVTISIGLHTDGLTP